MTIFYIILSIIIAIIIIYYFNHVFIINEHFCYGNTYCNGNKKNSLCINQECLNCGLQSSCNKNEDCGPNLCKEGCCDTM
jgi:hypothetical protein